MIDISVEISTFNRKDVLRVLLERLSVQTHPSDRFEVVLSDDGSTDGLLEMVDKLAPQLPFPLRILRGEHHGPGFTHNAGVRACRGEFVIMLASDILPVPELVGEHLRSHRDHPEPNVVVAGKLAQSGELPDSGIQRGFNELNEQIFANRSDTVKHGGFLVSNISFKRSFMLENGMFQEWPAAAGEDLELGYRLRTHNMVIQKNPRALGYHHHIETLESVARRAYMTGYNSHYFASEVDESWVRARFKRATPKEGIGAYLSKIVKDLLRPVVVNRSTTRLFVVPLIRLTEHGRRLTPVVAFLCQRMAAYYFEKGLRDQRNRREFDLSQAEI